MMRKGCFHTLLKGQHQVMLTHMDIMEHTLLKGTLPLLDMVPTLQDNTVTLPPTGTPLPVTLLPVAILLLVVIHQLVILIHMGIVTTAAAGWEDCLLEVLPLRLPHMAPTIFLTATIADTWATWATWDIWDTWDMGNSSMASSSMESSASMGNISVASLVKCSRSGSSSIFYVE